LSLLYYSAGGVPSHIPPGPVPATSSERTAPFSATRRPFATRFWAQKLFPVALRRECRTETRPIGRTAPKNLTFLRNADFQHPGPRNPVLGAEIGSGRASRRISRSNATNCVERTQIRRPEPRTVGSRPRRIQARPAPSPTRSSRAPPGNGVSRGGTRRRHQPAPPATSPPPAVWKLPLQTGHDRRSRRTNRRAAWGRAHPCWASTKTPAPPGL
jgi:hypothetical protein